MIEQSTHGAAENDGALELQASSDAPGGKPAALLAVDGLRLVSASADGLLAVWSGTAVARTFAGDGPVAALAVGHGLAALVRDDRELQVRGLDDGAVRARWPTAYSNDVFVDVAIAGPDRVLAATEERGGHPTDRVARLLEFRLSAPSEPPRQLAQGQNVLPPWSLAATYEDAYPDHERVPLGGAARERLGLPRGRLVSVDDPQGWLVLRASDDGALIVRAPDGTRTTLRIPEFADGPLRLTPDARHVVAWDPTGIVALFAVATGAERGRWVRARRELGALRAVVPCGGMLAVLEKEGRVRWLGPGAG